MEQRVEKREVVLMRPVIWLQLVSRLPILQMAGPVSPIPQRDFMSA
jgi:hypothetical protein